ncbi:DUF6415 family natural product biosynthesis protein [Streptomyces sp. NPDC085929]|uniref:DUF6415 family natural product biosynthesis protein n=1 Tax=Streptomyces sp. NPDC085929 TaxID=3365739 RepID=UPI0037D6DCA2
MSQPQDDDDDDVNPVVARALAEYAKRPSPEDVARLVDMLLTRGQEMHDIVAALPDLPVGASDVLSEWEYFSQAGPLGSGPHSNWHHCRGLARIVKRLMRMVPGHTTASAP